MYDFIKGLILITLLVMFAGHCKLEPKTIEVECAFNVLAGKHECNTKQ